MLEFLVIPACIAIDQKTKALAEEKLSTTETERCLNNQIGLRLVYNEGAFMGLFRNNRKLLMGVSYGSIFVLGITIFSSVFMKGGFLIRLGLSFMAGGATGNMIDRVKRKRVVDFFTFEKKPGVYFNLADLFVFLGALLVLVGDISRDLRK